MHRLEGTSGHCLVQIPSSKQGQLQEDQDLLQSDFRYLQGLGNLGTKLLGYIDGGVRELMHT